jgi:hypothetical protein
MFMKNINICLEDQVYDELIKRLEEMGQSPQSFYESYTKTVLRDRSRSFVVCASHEDKAWSKREKVKAFQRLEKIRLSSTVSLDYGQERELAIERKLKKS